MPVTLPDPTGALISFLRVHALLAPLHGGRVGTRLTSSATALRVAAIGGVQPAPWEATAEFQVEAWGGTEEEAAALAAAVCAAVYDLRGGTVPGGRVTAAVPTLRPLAQPDDNGRPRYITQVELTLAP